MRGGGRKMRHRTEICKPRERDAGLLVATTSFIIYNILEDLP